MGCGSSAPAVSGDTGPGKKRQKAADPSGKGAATQQKKQQEEHPDLGLSGSHELVKFLGRGGTGDTWLFNDRATGEEVAIKLVKRPVPKVIQPNLLREIRIQADLGEGHVNVIQAKEALLTDHHLALVMEYAACGSLTSYVAEKWQTAQHTGLFCSEDEARYFFRQFISAVEYCHGHFVAHRDLKLDNTLLSDDQPPLIKLCDFGFAREWQADALMYTHIGTPVYMAPELIHSRNGEHGYDGKQVDVWASGILLIVMLLGTFPYDHIENPDPNTTEAHEEVWEQQTRQPWDGIPHIEAAVKKLSDECRDLLNRIFVTNEKSRITVAEIKEHPWFKMPLSEEYAKAEQRILELQQQHNEYTASRKISTKMLKRRNEDLQKMLELASTRVQPGVAASTTPRLRIDLRESQILDNPASYASLEDNDLAGIREDEEGELKAQASNLRALMNGEGSR